LESHVIIACDALGRFVLLQMTLLAIEQGISLMVLWDVS